MGRADDDAVAAFIPSRLPTSPSVDPTQPIAERRAGVGSLSPLMYRAFKTLVALTNRCKVMASGRIDASFMRHSCVTQGGLAGIYFARPDMLEKKHRHTHMT